MVTSLLVYNRYSNAMCFYLEEDVLGSIIKQGLLTGVIFRFHTQPLIFTYIWSTKCRRRPPLTLLSWMLERTPSTKFHGKLSSQGSSGVCVLPFATVNDKRDFIFSRHFYGFSIIILTIGDWLILRLVKSQDRTFLTIPGWLQPKNPVALNCTGLDPSWRPANQPFCSSWSQRDHKAIPVRAMCMIQVSCEEADPS